MVKSKAPCPLYEICSIPKRMDRCIGSCPFYKDIKSASIIKGIYIQCDAVIDPRAILLLLSRVYNSTINVEVFGERIETRFSFTTDFGGSLTIYVPKHIALKLSEALHSIEPKEVGYDLSLERLILHFGGLFNIVITGDRFILFLLRSAMLSSMQIDFRSCDNDGCIGTRFVINSPIDYRKMVMEFFQGLDVDCYSTDKEMIWRCLMGFIMFSIRGYMFNECVNDSLKNDPKLKEKWETWINQIKGVYRGVI